ncbi:MAG: serine/threonine-protein kinase [Zavarzinella sp.]
MHPILEDSTDHAPKLAKSSHVPVRHAPPIVPHLQQVKNYDVLTTIGRGGMGVVYKARDRRTTQLGALKMIIAGRFASPASQLRFCREADALAKLDDANIVRLLETGEDNGTLFLALEYVEGTNLMELVQGNPQPPVGVARLVEVLARAISIAHNAGILHRDLKPTNIIVKNPKVPPANLEEIYRIASGLHAGPYTPYGVPKIIDFGLAKSGDEQSLTADGSAIGTPMYMSPEQFNIRADRPIGPTSDIYSLGVIMYELLTGRPPFLGNDMQMMLKLKLTHQPVPPSRLMPGISPDLDRICMICLARDPADRFQSGVELADALHQFLEGFDLRPKPPGQLQQIKNWFKNNWLLASMSAALGLTTAMLVMQRFMR